MASSSEPVVQQVRIRLAAKDSRYALQESAPILVPTSFRRLALSSLVNNLLEHEQTVPFDFIIRGSYLRTTLDEFLAENGISSETVIDAEYAPAQKPPRYVTSFEHDDWVSAVDVLHTTQHGVNQPRILSASYDGRLRVWEYILASHWAISWQRWRGVFIFSQGRQVCVSQADCFGWF